MYGLHIANKNYSSWSLRPWVLMTTVGIPFEEKLHRFPTDGSSSYPEFRKFSPTGYVPVLEDTDENERVWDSLSIVGYLAEAHPDVWPADRHARTWARSAASEMHSSFFALRNQCGMNVGIRSRRPPCNPRHARRYRNARSTAWAAAQRTEGRIIRLARRGRRVATRRVAPRIASGTCPDKLTGTSARSGLYAPCERP